MKLPELKNRLKNKYIVRVVAGVLTIALVGGGVGTTLGACDLRFEGFFSDFAG